MAEWKIVVKDKYPAYIDWESFERIQAMLRDNHAEYDRNKTRGVPATAPRLLQGLVWCGQCGHKMVVQYKGGNRYICNYLRQQPGRPGLPASSRRPDRRAGGGRVLRGGDAGRAGGLERAPRTPGARRTRPSTAPRPSRSSGCATRRCWPSASSTRSIPTTAWSPAELEHRWEVALRELRQAEDALARHRAARAAPETLSAEDRESFLALGPQLPALWQQPDMTRERKKALLRSLIDKVVLRRLAPDRISVRIVWRGGEVSDLEVEAAVYTHRALSRGAEMEARLLDLARQGLDDAAIAALLTSEGYRSARCGSCPRGTVRHIRQHHRVLRNGDGPTPATFRAG